MSDYNINPIDLSKASSVHEVAAFLQSVDLGFDDDVDFTLVVKAGPEVIGTCSKAGTLIKCLAVAAEYRGLGLSAKLVKIVIDRLFEEGRYHYFVVTKPDNTSLFCSLNFNEIYTSKYSVLMEGGIYSIEQRLNKIRVQAGIGVSTGRASLVMNCNPFTLGHLHLIEYAAKRESEVILFVVEEDLSVFRFKDRIEMVRAGTAHLPNVKILPGTEYIISAATFPSYFLRKSDERSAAFMEQDAGVFCRWFAPCFGIDTRYVGEEPYCEMTLTYNETLKRVFPKYGLKLIEIPRLAINGHAVSASHFRQALREGNESLAKSLVPESTWKYLMGTQQGQAALVRVKSNAGTH